MRGLTVIFIAIIIAKRTTRNIAAATEAASSYLRRQSRALQTSPSTDRSTSSGKFWSHAWPRLSSHPFHFDSWSWWRPNRQQSDPSCDSSSDPDCSLTTTTTNFIDPSQNMIYGHAILSASSSRDGAKVARVVGGVEAAGDEAPFFVVLLTWNWWQRTWQSVGCSGTMISNIHVLTAAHCVQGRKATNDAVYTNAYKPFSGNANYPFEIIRVVSYTIHRNFNVKDHFSDVAIITLERGSTTSSVMRVADTNMAVWNGQMASIYGFGQVSEFNASRVDTLRVARLPFITRRACQSYYNGGLLLDDMICAGLSRGGVDACYGDSGGGLFVRQRGGQYLVGTVSWGSGCGRREKPGVYSSVQYHHSWIQEVVCNDPRTDTTIDLCSTSPFPSLSPSDSTALITTSAVSSNTPISPSPTSSIVTSVRDYAGCVRKKTGELCMYGGECCSGVCALSTASSTTSRRRYRCRGTFGAPNAITSVHQKVNISKARNSN